jgi:glyoxylate reductase
METTGTVSSVFITRRIATAGLQLLQQAGITINEWLEKRELTPAELISHCKAHDALLSVGPNKLTADFLHACPHLKVIALHAVGFDNVAVDEATRLKIPVGNTPGVLSGATADTAFLLMLAVSRKAFYLHRTILNGKWPFFEPTENLGQELNGKTLGIVGLGKIGFEMAKKCQGAFNMKVIYHNRHPNPKAEAAFGATLVSFDELLQQSDVVSVHVNLSEETRNLFSKPAFAKMKPNAIFINTARGGIHNEADLLEALQEQTIWGAGLDVTNPEPMAPDNPLLKLPNVAVLPHIGSATRETRDQMAILAAENIIAGLAGKPLPHSVNPEVYTN